MAQQSKLLMYAQERFDLPDFNSVQNLVEADFQQQNKALITGNSTFVVKGLTVSHLTPPSLNIRIAVPNAALLNTKDDGTLFVAPSSASNIDVTMLDGATTYVWLTLGTTDGTPGLRTFWDPAALNGEGAEFQQTVNTIRTLTLSVATSTVGFPVTNDVIHLCVVTTLAGTVTALVDHRPLLFRLGRGGATNDADYTYPWSSGRDEPNPDLKTDANAFIGGDKQIGNLKDWMDVVMSLLKDIKGPGPWSDPPPSSLSDALVSMSGGGVFSWNSGTGQLSFTANIVFLIPGTAFINTIVQASQSPITLSADNQVAYVNLDRTSNANLVPVVVASSAYVPATDRLIIARRISGTAYVGID